MLLELPIQMELDMLSLAKFGLWAYSISCMSLLKKKPKLRRSKNKDFTFDRHQKPCPGLLAPDGAFVYTKTILNSKGFRGV